MAAPKWFDPKYYMQSKIAELKEDGYGDFDTLSLKAAFKAAGYSTDAEGLYQHFLDFGNAENVSPSPYFDANYYFQHKAADYFYGDQTYVNLVTESQVLFIKNAFAKAGLSAWDHYTKYGMREGIDPNANFSTSQYLTDKLAHLQELDPETYGSWTTDDLAVAWKDIDLNPVMHYESWGKTEQFSDGTYLTATPGSHGYVAQSLTKAVDNLSGTLGDPKLDEETGSITVSQDYDDYYTSEVGTLQSADTVDGLGGSDVFYGRVIGDAVNDNQASPENALEPTIKNVETILFRSEVEPSSTATNSGYVNYQSEYKVVSYIDADRFQLADGEQLTLGSDNSRADLSIEDLRHNSSETTIRFADADPGVNYWVYFDPQHLTSVNAEVQGYINVELMDVNHADTVHGTGHPLETNPYNQFRFAYVNGSNTDIITLTFRADDAALYTGTTATYSTLLTAFQHALEDFENAEGNAVYKGVFTIENGGSYTARAYSTTDNIEYSAVGTYITISTDHGSVNCDVTGTGWMTNGVVPPNTWYDTKVNNESSVECPLIVVTVELDNVGRVDWNDETECLPNDIINGSNAGDLEIGSMALRGGIERMDVLVDRGSWLDGLYSTNDTLRMITVKATDIGGAEDSNGIEINAHPDGIPGNADGTAGQLYIGAWKTRLDDNGNNAVNHTGYNHLTWTDPAKLLYADGATTGLKDVAVFDAASYAGEINIAAAITEDSYDKYLKSVDGQRVVTEKVAPLTAYNGNFTYNTGTADDVVNMTVNGDIAADVDFKLVINSSDGDDLVAFRYNDMSTEQSLNQKYLQNATINAGTGGDTVWFYAGNSSSVNYSYNEPEYSYVYGDVHKFEVSAYVKETIKTYTYTEHLYQYEDTTTGKKINYYLQPDGETYIDDNGDPVAKSDLPKVSDTGVTRVTVYKLDEETGYYVNDENADDRISAAEIQSDKSYVASQDDKEVKTYYEHQEEMVDGTINVTYETSDGEEYIPQPDEEPTTLIFVQKDDESYVNIDDKKEVLPSDTDVTINDLGTVRYVFNNNDGKFVNEYDASDVLTDEQQSNIDFDSTQKTETYYIRSTGNYEDENGRIFPSYEHNSDYVYESGYNESYYYKNNGKYYDTQTGKLLPDYIDENDLIQNDYVYGTPSGSVRINGEDGADVIYANQFEFFTGGAGSGVTNGADQYNAVFTFNTYKHDDYYSYQTAHKVGIDGYNGATLNNNIGTGLETFALSQTEEAITAKASHLYLTVNYNGFVAESEIAGLSLNTSSGETSPTFKVDGHKYLTAEQINHAIINAIENDTSAMNGHALSDLLSAKDGSGHSLLIESKINGPIDEDAISIGLEYRIDSTSTTAKTYDASTPTINSFYSPHYALDNSYSRYDGADSYTTSQATINGGAGNDLIVLGNNHFGWESIGRDVVTLSASFGNDTIIDFGSEDYIAVGGILSYNGLAAAPTSLSAGNAYVLDNTAATETDIKALVGGTLRFGFSEEVSSKALVFLHDTGDETAEVYTAALLTKSTAKDSTTVANAEVTVLGSLTFADDAITNDQLGNALVGSIALVDNDDITA